MAPLLKLVKGCFKQLLKWTNTDCITIGNHQICLHLNVYCANPSANGYQCLLLYIEEMEYIQIGNSVPRITVRHQFITCYR